MNASVSVGVVVERNEDTFSNREVLFVVREDGKLCIPSGHWERGETLVECARREFREETGFEVSIDGLARIILLTREKDLLRLGLIYHGLLGKKVSEPETGIRWVNHREHMDLVMRNKLFMPGFNIPAFMDCTKETMLTDWSFLVEDRYL